MASRTTLYRFVFTVGLFLVWLSMQSGRLADGTLATALFGAALMTGLLAIVFREPFRGPSLNRWDEMLAYLGVAALVRTVS